MAKHYMGETDYGRQRLPQNMALLDIPPDRRAEGGDTVELKPCPFCGGEAFMRKLYTTYFVDAKHDENCPMNVRLNPYESHWVTRLAAEEAWNRRANDG